MSGAATEAVWDNSKCGPGTPLTIMLRIADHTNAKGYSWPGINKLADRCRCSPRTVMRQLVALEKLGEL